MKKRESSWNPLLCSYPDSKKVNSVSFEAETLFTRLIAKCDDAANFDGRPSLMMCKLFAERLDRGQVTAARVEAWRNELIEAGLIVLYKANGDEYVHIANCKKCTRKDIKPDIRFPGFSEDAQIVPDAELGPKTERPRNESGTGKKQAVSQDEFVSYWNEHKTLPAIKDFGPSRVKQLKARSKESAFAENWKAIIHKLSNSKFHTGNNDRGWKATVDWILKNDTNYMKILETPDNGDSVDKALGLKRPSIADVEQLENELGCTL